MKKTVKKFLKPELIIFLIISISALPAIYFLIPDKFETAVKSLWKDGYLEEGEKVKGCLRLPVPLNNNLKWTLSISQKDPIEPAKRSKYTENKLSHDDKIVQLDALVNIGFLKKFKDIVTVGSWKATEQVPGFRYHITPIAAAYGSGGDYLCLTYSHKNPEFLSVDEVLDIKKTYSVQDQEKLDRFKITQLVKVTFSIGYSSDEELFPWVKDSEVSRAFGFKSRHTRVVTLMKIDGVWIPANSFSPGNLKPMTDKERRQYLSDWERGRLQERRSRDHFTNTGYVTVYPHEIASGSFPSKNRILSEFKKEYQSGNVGNRNWYRLDSPGKSSDFPVDYQKNISECDGSESYKVGIITEENATIAKRDRRIMGESFPYLQDLESRGILYSYAGQITLENEQSYSGVYFEPNKLFKEAFNHCLHLNEPRFELIKASTYKNQISFDTVARYTRPQWATDEVVKNFEELRLILEYGSTNIARNPAYDLPLNVRNSVIRYQ